MAGGRQLGCLVRSAPFTDRSGRRELDVILAAAACGWRIELFFSGAGVLHLVPEKDSEGAGLPRTWRGWKALAEAGPVRCWVESDGVPLLGGPSASPLLDVEELGRAEIAGRLRHCDRVMVL